MKQNIPQKLKLSNRKIVYELLAAQGGGLSRADLARMTGISGATVLKIVDCFQRKGIVHCDAPGAAGVGRPPAPLRFDAGFAHIVAICLEGAYASVGVVDALGGTVACREARVGSLGGYFSGGLFEDIDAVLAAAGGPGRCVGIGVALPFSFDAGTLRVQRAPLLDPGWDGLAGLRQALQARYGLPVVLENDVNAGAYGEYRRVYAGRVQDMVYLSLGTGLGGGLILGGGLRRGSHNNAGEVGGLQGSLEQQVNLGALARRFGVGADALLAGHAPAGVVEYLAGPIARAVADVQLVLDVEQVVLGGVLARALGPALLRAVRGQAVLGQLPPGLLQAGRLEQPGLAGLGYLVADQLLDQLLDDEASPGG